MWCAVTFDTQRGAGANQKDGLFADSAKALTHWHKRLAPAHSILTRAGLSQAHEATFSWVLHASHGTCRV